MNKHRSKMALQGAYNDLKPYSDKFINDFERYLTTIDFLQQISLLKKKKILDIGTGIGLMPLALKKLQLNSAGLDYHVFPESPDERFKVHDINELLIKWESLQLRVYNIKIGDTQTKNRIGKFDVLICECTIEHLKDPKQFLEWCSSLLNPKGYLLLTTPNLVTLIKRLRFIMGKSCHWPIDDFYNSGENFTGHWREYTMQELKYMLEKGHFKILEASTQNVLTKFKSFSNFRKNIRAVLRLISTPFTGLREIHYLLAQK